MHLHSGSLNVRPLTLCRVSIPLKQQRKIPRLQLLSLLNMYACICFCLFRFDNSHKIALLRIAFAIQLLFVLYSQLQMQISLHPTYDTNTHHIECIWAGTHTCERVRLQQCVCCCECVFICINAVVKICVRLI